MRRMALARALSDIIQKSQYVQICRTMYFQVNRARLDNIIVGCVFSITIVHNSRHL